MMKKIIHKAESRGEANHGWLKSRHTFSFASYYNPERVHFGVLRVLNDDEVAAGMGFGAHPHDNMEIVSIPLRGDLEHKDNTGRHEIIRTNDVQIMSAGKGIQHSEVNASKTEPVHFLQIWVLPKEKNITPRYEQKTFEAADRQNKFQVVVSPNPEEGGVWINQDAWFLLCDLNEGHEVDYKIRKAGNGIYLFILEGEVIVEGETLSRRDAIGLSDIEGTTIKANLDSKLLLMEVPV